MLEDAMGAIESAGFKPGREVCLGLDVAATHFYSNGVYHLGKQKLDSLAGSTRIDNNDIPNPDSLKIGQVLRIPDD